MYSLFVSACLTIQAVDAFKSASEVCVVEVIKFFTHFFLLNHINRLRISLFKLVWQDNETAHFFFPLDKGFLLSSANHVDCTYISLKVTFCCFVAKLLCFQLFCTGKRFSPVWQVITMILAISHSQQHFCIFSAQLR